MGRKLSKMTKKEAMEVAVEAIKFGMGGIGRDRVREWEKAQRILEHYIARAEAGKGA
jgi:hypothetical protein